MSLTNITKNVNKDVAELTRQIVLHWILRQILHQNQINLDLNSTIGNVNISNTSWT